MRLRSFSAASVAEAMALVRAALGADAIIVATERAPAGGCVVTAALDDDGDDAENAAADRTGPLEAIAAAMARHGVPLALAQQLGRRAVDSLTEGAAGAFAAAIAVQFRFAPLELTAASRILLIGPPGAGKTVTAAKLAARQVLARRPVRLISTDTARAGGVEQLAALARVLGLPLEHADGPVALAEAIAVGASAALVIDSAGFNPYRAGERAAIAALIAAARAEPVLVLPAGTDAVEAVELAAGCAEFGCRRLIATRLDLARRFGSLLAAADAAELAFADIGVAPDIADGLCPLTPLGLARLLLPDAAPVPPTPASLDQGDRR